MSVSCGVSFGWKIYNVQNETHHCKGSEEGKKTESRCIMFDTKRRQYWEYRGRVLRMRPFRFLYSS